MFNEDGLFKGANEAAWNELENKPLVGRGETLVAPPATGENQVPKWNGEAWEVIEYHMGRFVWATEGNVGSKAKLGWDVEYHFGPIPEGWTDKERPGEFFDWNGTDWVENKNKKAAAAAEIARLREFSNDEVRKDLQDKLNSASPAQIRAHISNLFPNLTVQQRRFLAGLVMLHKD